MLLPDVNEPPLTLPLTCDVGEFILKGADVSDVNVEEWPELRHGHTHPGDGDVCQAAAAVH